MERKSLLGKDVTTAGLFFGRSKQYQNVSYGARERGDSMEKLKCKLHPTYHGIGAPRVSCERCWAIYFKLRQMLFPFPKGGSYNGDGGENSRPRSV